MKSTARIAKAALALLAALAATGCESKEDRYLADLEARVATLEETVKAGDRAAYDEAVNVRFYAVCRVEMMKQLDAVLRE